MRLSSLRCTKCRNSLPVEGVNTGDWVNCSFCGAAVRVHVFPALFNAPASDRPGEALRVGGEAGCFYHPHKKAVVPCDLCGRFLCGLCDLELDGRHLCSSCVETGKRTHKLRSLENHRILYDRIALALAFWPLLVWPATFLTAPAALFVSIRYWKSPSGLIARSKLGFILAVLLAVAQIAGWAALMILITHSLMGGS